jgi:hypothetical protein
MGRGSTMPEVLRTLSWAGLGAACLWVLARNAT